MLTPKRNTDGFAETLQWCMAWTTFCLLPRDSIHKVYERATIEYLTETLIRDTEYLNTQYPDTELP